MNLTSKEFLAGMAGGTVVLLIQGCGGGGGDSGDSTLPPANTCGAAGITANHGHALTIARADLDLGHRQGLQHHGQRHARPHDHADPGDARNAEGGNAGGGDFIGSREPQPRRDGQLRVMSPVIPSKGAGSRALCLRSQRR